MNRLVTIILLSVLVATVVETYIRKNPNLHMETPSKVITDFSRDLYHWFYELGKFIASWTDIFTWVRECFISLSDIVVSFYNLFTSPIYGSVRGFIEYFKKIECLKLFDNYFMEMIVAAHCMIFILFLWADLPRTLTTKKETTVEQIKHHRSS